ncbi:diacylglycerol kinase family lipid kinase [Pedobacter sp. BS3]|nr:diacylglycerol kinase family lipid kinase [Pedobacter sp. BS3]
MKKHIVFIINPISGGKHKANFPKLANEQLDKQCFLPVYRFTDAPGHGSQLAAEALADGADIVVAVGGDGTINEVGSVMEGSGKIMGIVPCGSGNGLARALKIPMSRQKAVNRLNTMQAYAIDSGVLNGKKFFNMAGMGFDARISARFAKGEKRGLGGYITNTLAEIKKYQPENYILNVDGLNVERRAFMLSIANSSQYGNNAHVSPTATVKDGLLDVCIIKPFPLYEFPAMVTRMFTKTADKSRYVEIIKGKDIKISRQSEGPVHVDGEPYIMGTEINVQVKPASLLVIS